MLEPKRPDSPCVDVFSPTAGRKMLQLQKMDMENRPVCHWLQQIL